MDDKVRVCKTTSFVNKLSDMTPVSQFLRTNCFIRHKIVQNMVWVMQYGLKQFVVSAVD